MKMIQLTHANLVRKEVYLIPGPNTFWWYDTNMKATVIFTGEKLSFPVLETPEQIAQLIKANSPVGQETKNESEAVRRPAVNVRKRKTRKDGRTGQQG